ncbi:hypothetical protein PPACK8108_LOCUS22007 [Phakopsora pachyrhizi]|uniref:Uncharacterized protein n=1 Tax=Phakopsora pachyrhizi TaxID=170000 RepID=A0AAV0BKP6_PHAPC|nr:hypothetical protein PPACK8108_LOCUS22007 [Phakopsora pachyrhizi]
MAKILRQDNPFLHSSKPPGIACLQVTGHKATVENILRMIIALADKVIKFSKHSKKKSGYVSAGTIMLVKDDGTWAVQNLKDPLRSPTTVLTAGLPADTCISYIIRHPNGVMLAVGLSNSTLMVFYVKNATSLSNFEGHKESGCGPIVYHLVRKKHLQQCPLNLQQSSCGTLGDYQTITPLNYSAKFIGVIGNDLRVWQSKT